jgi:hypothetical protein
MGAGDDDVTCPNNGYNDSQCDQFNHGYDAGFNSTCIAAHKGTKYKIACTSPYFLCFDRLVTATALSMPHSINPGR